MWLFFFCVSDLESLMNIPKPKMTVLANEKDERMFF